MRAAIRALGVVRNECSILHRFVHFVLTYQSTYYDLCTFQYILHCNKKNMFCFVFKARKSIAMMQGKTLWWNCRYYSNHWERDF